MSARHSQIVATGSALPARATSNQELADRLAQRGVETSDEWIVARTGIRQRYFAEDGLTSAELGARASKEALRRAGIAPDRIDLIVVATSTSDQIFPSTACAIQRLLGCAGAAAFDVQAVCSGFVYALAVADAMLRAGPYRRALVIGTEVFSRILDWDDRTTCVLFGDGAGALVLEAAPVPGILACRLHADGGGADILCAAGRVDGGKIVGDPFLRMDGKAVFKRAVTALEASARQVTDDAGLSVGDIDWLIPHQANIRILDALAKRLGLPDERLVATVAQHGNTSAASVALALDWAIEQGKVRRGQTVLLQGVGGGFTWGSALARY